MQNRGRIILQCNNNFISATAKAQNLINDCKQMTNPAIGSSRTPFLAKTTFSFLDAKYCNKKTRE